MLDPRLVSRRKVLKGLAMAAAIPALASCKPAAEPTKAPAGEEGTQAEEQPTAAPKEVTKITMWHQMSGIPAETAEAMIEMFNDDIGAELGVEAEAGYVAAEEGTQASQKFMTSIVGGNPPDTYFFDRFLVAAWAAENLFTCMDPYIEADAAEVDLDDFVEFAKRESTLCDKYYALPIFTDCCLLWWRKDHFRDVGLDPDRPPQNREELDEYSDLLTKRRDDGSYERMGLIPDGIHYGWAYHYIGTPSDPKGVNFWDFDKQTAACDDPQIVECVKWMKTYYDKYDVDLVSSFREGFGGGETDPFGMGLVSMQRNGDWMFGTYNRYFPELEYGTSLVPIPGGLSESSCGGGWCMVIPNGASSPDAAWELSKYFTNPEGMAYYCEHDPHLPVRQSVAEMPFNEEIYPGDLHDPWIEALPNLWNRPAIPAGQVLWTEINAAEDRIQHGQAGVVEALQDVNTKVNEAMAEFSCSQLQS